MRVALCLSGQPRFYEKAFPFTKENVIDPNGDVDVFIHTWFDKEDVGKEYETSFIGNIKIKEDIDKDLKEMFKPKVFVAEKQKQFVLPRDYSPNKTKTPPFILFSLFYSIWKSNKLKKEYEQKNGFKYDWVIRHRCDLVIQKKIELEKYSKTAVHFLNDVNPKISGGQFRAINDQFAFSNSENMDAYSKMFYYLDKYWAEEGARMGGEKMLYHHIEKNQLPYELHNFEHYLIRN